MVAKVIATVFGIGYIQKGAGTVAALFYCGLWWYANGAEWPWWWQLLLIATVFIAGVWSGNVVQKGWGHDSNRVVIDEVLGMAIALFLMPKHIWFVAGAFVLFRILDVFKPLGIYRMERLPGGIGVMMDDLLAGVYACAIIHLGLFVYITYFVQLP